MLIGLLIGCFCCCMPSVLAKLVFLWCLSVCLSVQELIHYWSHIDVTSVELFSVLWHDFDHWRSELWLIGLRCPSVIIAAMNVINHRAAAQPVATAATAAASATVASPGGGFSSDSPPDFDASQPSTNIQVRLADGSRWVTRVFLLPALARGTPRHHISGGTWTTDISSMHWRGVCLGYSRPRRIVTNLLSCALEAYLLTCTCDHCKTLLAISGWLFWNTPVCFSQTPLWSPRPHSGVGSWPLFVLSET